MKELEASLADAKESLKNLRAVWSRMKVIEGSARFPRDDHGRPLFPISPSSITGASPGDQDEYGRLLREEAKLVNQTYLRHQKFLDLDAAYYQIQPRPVSVPLLKIEGAARTAVTWKRRFELRFPDPGESAQTPGEILQAPSFFLHQDETVVLLEAGFQYPGYTALCMYHECGHLQLFRAAGKISKDMDSEEIQIRQATLPLLIETFDLQPGDWVQEILDLEGLHRLLEKRRENPLREPVLSPPEMVEIRKQIIRGLADLTLLIGKHGPNSGPVEEFRTTSGLRFLENLPPSAIPRLAHDWADVRQRWASLSNEGRRTSRGKNARLVLEELRHGSLPLARVTTAQEAKDRLQEERLRWEREARDRDKFREAEQKRHLARQAERRRRRDADWIYLKSLAQLACSDPDALDAQAEKAAVVPSPIDAIRLGSHIAWESRGPGSLSACQKWTLQKIEETVWRGNRATTADISAWVRIYRKEHPGAVKFIGDALGQFTKSLAELIKAFLPDPGPATRTPSSRSEEDRPERSPEPDCGPPNSETGIVGCCVTGCR